MRKAQVAVFFFQLQRRSSDHFWRAGGGSGVGGRAFKVRLMLLFLCLL